MEIKGYKGFCSGLKNKYDASFEEGKVYSKDPVTLRFGVNGHGYHMTAKLADTFRFFNLCRDNVYCEVIGFGKIIEEDDYLYNSDSMYAVEKFKIVRVLSREDIFEYVCNADFDEFSRFLALYPFTKEELQILRELVINRDKEYQKVFDSAIGERQNGDIDNFKREKKYLRRI